MPLELPLLQSATRFDTFGENTANSSADTISLGASNAKGSWAELSASTPWPSQGIIVQFLFSGTANQQCLVDIGIGGAGSEQVIIPDISYYNWNDLCWGYYYFPVKIPGSTRLAVRGQNSAGTAQNLRVKVTLVGGGYLGDGGFTRVLAYGANTADSGGVSVDPGATANTKGSWVEIVASTTNPTRQILLALSDAAGGRATASWLLDIGIGGAGSEQVLIPDMILWNNINMNEFRPMSYGPIPCHIPAGTRIAARAQCDITEATDRLFDLIIYGID